MIPWTALAHDLAQRLVTLNKLEQRRYLAAAVARLALPAGARALDFGCGTALFAPTLQSAGLDYCGYDPGADLVAYASRLYPGRFVSQLHEAAAAGPYDLVLANCCFHHIDDEELRRQTLPFLAGVLRPGGRLLLRDVLPLEPHASLPRRLFNRLEQGERKRTAAELRRLVTGPFVVRREETVRAYVLSMPNPVYNNLVLFELAPA